MFKRLFILYDSLHIREEYTLYKEKADTLDQDWIDLMLEALDAGIAIQDIEHFFQRMNQPTRN
ncbi:hypothetical protein bmyco0003_10720 [Bacillus pseudomycoides]|nr:hypothetical protein bmyco0003_10720 [Bacillus pseudomycoides]